MGGRHPPVSEPGEGPDLSGDRPRAAAPRKRSGTPLGRPRAAPAPGVRGDRYGGPQVPVHDRRDGIPLDSTRAGAASTPPPSSPGTWRATALAPRWAGPGCAGRVPGRKPAGATLKEREGLSDGPPPQEPRPPGIPPPRSTPVHTIRDSSTPPRGTGHRARPTRSTEQQDNQPETPLSKPSETHPAAHIDALHCPDRQPRQATHLVSYNGSRAVPTETAILMIYLSGHVVQVLVPAKILSCP